MTLDERIQKDLTELYNGGDNQGEIKDAVALNDLIQAKPGQTSFATRALPGYYAGDRKAKTVLVMLNPGMDVDKANDNLKCDICKHSMKNAADIENYHQWCVEYGHIDRSRLDNFDLKQAFFLHNWKDTGISLPDNLCASPKSDKDTLLKAKETVLTQKLQIELIPYASSSFSAFNKKMLSLTVPFVETLFDEIFSQDRNYVVFCSKMFKDVFEEYNKVHQGAIDFVATESQIIPGSKINGSCSIVLIHHQNKTVKALIANTFPNQALPNAYHLMEKYGDFCYQQYCQNI